MKTQFAFVFAALSQIALAQSPAPLPQSGNVSLPLDEYNRLKELAARPPKPADPAPMAYAIQSAALKLRVADRAVTGTIQLDGEVLQQGPVKAALVSGMTVLDARQGAAALPITQENGTHSAVLAGPGPFSIALDAGLPVVFEPGRAWFTIPAPAAGAVRLSFTVPGEQTIVTLTAGLITGRASSAGATQIEATLVPGKSTTVSWAVRLSAAPPAAPKELRFLSDVKTLVSVNAGEVTLASLAEITVTQGEASRFEMDVPAGYEITGATGASLLKSEARPGGVILYVNGANIRSHQFLISMTKLDNAAKLEIALPAFHASQRETGEALVEGAGTLELDASPKGGLRRADIKEASLPLRSLATEPVYAAFRYQKKPGEAPGIGLEWTRFADASELAAVAQQAVVTTLVTSEGRSLTEVKLTVKNQSQPFVKIDLPAGASILSADVAGEKVKPVQGADGSRIPLLRPGFRPTGAYTVSFVFLHSGAPFAKKGAGEIDLPKMDIPVGVVQWEVFLPKQYAVAEFGGDAMSAALLPAASDREEFAELRGVGNAIGYAGGTGPGSGIPNDTNDTGKAALDALMVSASTSAALAAPLAPGQLGGYVMDPTGGRLANASVTVTNLDNGATRTVAADRNGHWMLPGFPAGRLRVVISAPGFVTQARESQLTASSPATVNTTLGVGGVNESIEVRAEASTINTSTASISKGANKKLPSPDDQKTARQNAADKDASQNVFDLQKRVAGVLPIAIDIPRAGNSYHFVRPLVVAEVTRLTFNYKTTK